MSQQDVRWLQGLALAVLSAVATGGGCSCGDNPGGLAPPVIEWVCQEQGRRPGGTDVACPDGKVFTKGECVPERCDADENLGPNCCPGMFCTAGGACQVPPSRITTCTTDTECDPGQRCLDRPRISTESGTCGFVPVETDGSCPDGGQAFNGRCVVGAPCGGSCTPGSVCNIDLNRCETTPALVGDGHGCDASCGESQLLIYEDPDAMLFDQCCEVRCVCATLPPLEPGNWGRFSDLSVRPGEIRVSGYDTTYGDLVVGRFDRLTGIMQSLDYVDGVPSSGNPVADPNGPRAGIDVPGPDVGQYTAMAQGPGGETRIAYYDVESGNLKYAVEDATPGTWSVSVVDDDGDQPDDVDDTADVGTHTDMVVDSTGVPHVTYYAHRLDVGGTTVTTAMYARATSATPTGPDDWVRVPIEPVSSCDGACGLGMACVDVGGQAQCHPLDDTDAPACDSCDCDHACVDSGSGLECLLELPNLLGPPCDGSCPDGEVCVADPIEGATCLAERSSGACDPGCEPEQLCVGDTGSEECRLLLPISSIEGLPAGVGLFTSMVLHNDLAHVVYYDRLRQHLRGAIAQFDTSEDPIGNGFAVWPLVCDPLDDVGQHASLAVATDGTLAVGYQRSAGETLWVYQGSDFATGAETEVDDGIRDGRVHLVGASAEVAFDAQDTPIVVYADQTANDLMLAVQQTDESWERHTLLSDGAHGSFARIGIEGRKAWVSTYLRGRNAADRDISRIVVEPVDLDSLP